MKKLVLAAVTVFALSMPAMAQDKKGEEKEPEVKITEADISKAITNISALGKDAAKLKSYCEMLELGAKADEALEKNDEKKAEEFGKKAEGIADTLGDDFNDAMGVVSQVDPDAKESEALFKAVDALDAACAKK